MQYYGYTTSKASIIAIVGNWVSNLSNTFCGASACARKHSKVNTATKTKISAWNELIEQVQKKNKGFKNLPKHCTLMSPTRPVKDSYVTSFPLCSAKVLVPSKDKCQLLLGQIQVCVPLQWDRVVTQLLQHINE